MKLILILLACLAFAIADSAEERNYKELSENKCVTEGYM